MVSEQVQQIINYLIQVELNSAYLYLAMANYFDRLNLVGMAKWLRAQSEEERGHAQFLTRFVLDLGGVVESRAILAQPVDFGTPLQVWQQVLEHERFVTQAYQQAYRALLQVGEYQALGIVQEILQEQIDEIAQPLQIVGRLGLVQASPAGILLMDRELAEQANGEDEAALSLGGGGGPASGERNLP